ncbi:FecR family protein [Flagellimonas sp. S3867]|uniref:FecR family protein n=1 Tax=Flagellimonas sp. S3867 TaxID=2768063 RepID=UPI0016824377|nr:FecR family protein [Flagellimonas sp. S3867]
MLSKEFNTIDDFVSDSSFVNWAKKQNQNDVVFWEDWIKNNPGKTELVIDAKNIILGIAFKKESLPQYEIDKAWNKLPINQIDRPLNKFNWAKYVAVAASVCLLIASYFFLSQNNTINYKTGYGQLMAVNLPDGTEVMLNANSSITFDETSSRNIMLEGEAYFKVEKKKASNAKFYVHTNDLSVEVYGTEFNVNAKHNKTDVTLDEGNIQIKLKNGLIKAMVPGDQISYSQDTDQVLKHKSIEKHRQVSSWKDGTLVFENALLYEVVKRIEDTYGLKAKFLDGESPNQIITGGIPTKNLIICIQAIEKASNTIITIDNEELTIKMKK